MLVWVTCDTKFFSFMDEYLEDQLGMVQVHLI